MPVIKLTQSFINTARCPPDVKRIEYVDTDAKGMYYLLSATTEPGQGTLYLRSKIDGKTVHTKIGRASELDLSQARGEAKRLAAEIALGRNPQAESHARKDGLTFGDFFTDHYLPYVKPRKRSWKRDEELFRLRIEKVLGSTKLDKITRQQLQLFHTDLRAEGLAPATCDHHIKLIKHALNLAIDWGMLAEKNPAARIPLYSADNRVDNIPNEAQMAKLFQVLRTDSHRSVCQIVLFLLATGMRLQEALQLRWSDVQLDSETLRVTAQNSKSKRQRTLPLSMSALTILDEVGTRGIYEFVFINKKTETRYTTIAKPWNRLRTKAEVPTMRIHDMRHAYLTALSELGYSGPQIMALAGHAQFSTTARYLHVGNKVLRDASNAASARLDPVGSSTANQPHESPTPTATPAPKLVEIGPRRGDREAA